MKGCYMPALILLKLMPSAFSSARPIFVSFSSKSQLL